MSKYKTIGQALDALANVGTSKHRAARVQRFIYRNKSKHSKIIKRLEKMRREHEEQCKIKFNKMQREGR